jgi:hypothetical protein
MQQIYFDQSRAQSHGFYLRRSFVAYAPHNPLIRPARIYVGLKIGMYPPAPMGSGANCLLQILAMTARDDDQYRD